MIGAAISMRYVGKKSWTQSIVFWAVVLVAGLAAVAFLSGSAVAILAGPAVFIGLAHYWYKFKWMKSIVIFAVAYAIDITIFLVVGATLLGLLGMAG